MKQRPTLGAVVKAWRLQRGMTQTGLGSAFGQGKGYVSQVERGRIRRPSEERLSEFARGLRVPVSVLETREMPPQGDLALFGGKLDFDGTEEALEGAVSRVRRLLDRARDGQALEEELALILSYLAWREHEYGATER